jgi:hypothetical protein
MRRPRTRFVLPAIFLGALALNACRKPEITAYTAPKDPPPLVAGAPGAVTSANAGRVAAAEPSAPSANAPATATAETSPAAGAVAPMTGATLPSSAVSASQALMWTAPGHWTEKPTGPVRKGSFVVRSANPADANAAEADLSITAFPGEVGGLLANVNRWRGELALAPLADADLAANTTQLATGQGGDALTFTLVDFAGALSSQPARTLGAIVRVGADTWFFKLRGPDALVAGEREAFFAFLKTVRPRG